MTELKLTLPWPPFLPGTYRIEDSKTGAFYIGSAADLNVRWRRHRSDLQRGIHHNRRMQRIWNRDQARLSFSVVQELVGVSRQTRLDREQALLDAAKVGDNVLCLNAQVLARSSEGRVFSHRSRAKMRAAKLGKKLSPAHRAALIRSHVGQRGPRHAASQIAKWRRYTNEQVAELRKRVAAGAPVYTTAKQLGMSRATARRILAGESYVA